jgi:ATP-dependent DNA helicase RecQ
MEAYYQEAGRAGRDEKLAYAILLAHPVDGDQLIEKTNRAHPSIDYLKAVYQSLSNYYKIAVGSNLLSSFDFELEDFSRQYKLNAYEAYNALRKLEEEGLVQLNESFYKPSKLMLLINASELYSYQVANAALDSVLKGLLRLYGGEIFSSFITISEGQISQLININKAEVVKKLEYMHQSNVLVYERQKEKPQLTFTSARQDANRLIIDIKQLEHRKSASLSRVRKMISYTYEATQCRTQQFQGYFGELSVINCGNCDVCIRRKKELKNINIDHNYSQQVLDMLCKGEQSIEHILRQINAPDSHHLYEVLREMQETDQIAISASGQIKLG